MVFALAGRFQGLGNFVDVLALRSETMTMPLFCPGFVPGFEFAGDLRDVRIVLREDHVFRPPGKGDLEGQVSGPAAHDLDEKELVMAIRGIAEPINGIEGRVDAGLESDGVIGAVKVVVDGAGHADDLAGPDLAQFQEADGTCRPRRCRRGP